MEQPKREKYEGHECVCLLVAMGVDLMTGKPREMRDKCHCWVNNPDQAFCNSCEAGGHADLEQQQGRKVQVHGQQAV